jgi:hypothetical protein
MALEMKSVCERCQSHLDPQVDAYICSFECTFCPACAKAREGICPNCGGEIVRRPRRKVALPVAGLDDGSTEAASITT